LAGTSSSKVILLAQKGRFWKADLPKQDELSPSPRTAGCFVVVHIIETLIPFFFMPLRWQKFSFEFVGIEVSIKAVFRDQILSLPF